MYDPCAPNVPRETIPIMHCSCCPHCEPHIKLMEKLIAEIRETDRTLEKILKALKR